MTRIDFYSNVESKLHTVCKIAARALRAKNKMIILAADESMTRSIDKLLWTYQPISFLPHPDINARLADKTQILVTEALELTPHTDVLVNLTHLCPNIFSRFARLIEIVGTDADDKSSARGRWKYYKDRGYSIIHHDFAKAES